LSAPTTELMGISSRPLDCTRANQSLQDQLVGVEGVAAFIGGHPSADDLEIAAVGAINDLLIQLDYQLVS
jgi:hypothetical protein